VLQGYPRGFPLLLPVGVSAQRAQQLVGHLLDGNYLDDAGSKALSAELLTYNPDLQLLGYVAGSFTWTKHGAVEGRGRAVRRRDRGRGARGSWIKGGNLMLAVGRNRVTGTRAIGCVLKGQCLCWEPAISQDVILQAPWCLDEVDAALSCYATAYGGPLLERSSGS
jgi:hypothetical protein